MKSSLVNGVGCPRTRRCCATISTVVRHLSDPEVLTVQLVENLQRVDLHPLEEAEFYELTLKHGASIEELLRQVGTKAGLRA